MWTAVFVATISVASVVIISSLLASNLFDDVFEGWVLDIIEERNKNRVEEIDLRVTKAIGDRGYNVARVSVITSGRAARDALIETGFKFDYVEPFKYRWTHSFNLGSHGKVCPPESVFERFRIALTGSCMKACQANPGCHAYTLRKGAWWQIRPLCLLSSNLCNASGLVSSDSKNEVSYLNMGQRYLHSKLVRLNASGTTELQIGKKKISINLPAEDSSTSGVIIADPCYSGRWIPCEGQREKWNMFENTFGLLNALAKDESIHFFQILGDNFYDRDGRLTKAIYDQFSLELKSRFFSVSPGNHDIWVIGGPPGNIHDDQYGHGFMQWYAHDSYSSLVDNSGVFNFSIDPDDPDAGDKTSGLRNSPNNFVWWHKIGNIGFIGYSGIGDLPITALESGCAYFNASKPEYIFVVGHFNLDPGYLVNNLATPELRAFLLETPGCDIGSRLKFFDGHKHCHGVQETELGEPVGFLTGNHGMDDYACGMNYGFTFVDSNATEGRLRIWHFVEHNASEDRFDDIVQCLVERGRIAACTHLAELWFETEMESNNKSSTSYHLSSMTII